jgi:transcriptional/translational regulatory protein YebC/TACO1
LADPLQKIECNPEDFASVKEAIERLALEADEFIQVGGELVYMSQVDEQASDGVQIQLRALLDELEDHEDVLRVWTTADKS